MPVDSTRSSKQPLHSSAPTWGGIASAVNTERVKSPQCDDHDTKEIEEWIHEMTTYCETLPLFVVHDHPMAMMRHVVNFDRNHLKARFRLTSTQCNAIYRLLFVYSTGFFDNVAEWIKRSKNVVIDRDSDTVRTEGAVHYDVVLQYMARLYCSIMQSVAATQYEMECKVIDAAAMMELEQYQVDQQRLTDRLTLKKRQLQHKATAKTNKMLEFKASTQALDDKIKALKSSVANYDSAISDFEAILVTQRRESEDLVFRIHDYKASAQRAKDQEFKLNVLIPIDVQNQNVLWKALSKLKADIESVVKRRKQWILKLKVIEAQHQTMEDAEFKVDQQLSAQQILNHDENAKKQEFLRRMDSLNALQGGEGVIAQMQAQIKRQKLERKERAYHLDEVRLNVIELNEEYDALEYGQKTKRNEIFSAQNRVESINQNIGTIFASIESTEKAKVDQETKFKVVQRAKRLVVSSIESLKGEFGAISDELNVLRRQNEIREHQFELSQRKLSKNEVEIDAMNHEEKALKAKLFSNHIEHQEVRAEVERRQNEAESQNVHFEAAERFFDHRIEYELQRYSTLDGRLSALRCVLESKHQELSDKMENIEDTQQSIAMTVRKSEAVQLQIDSLSQQILSRRQKIWRLETIRNIKRDKLAAIKRQSATKTDSVDHVFDRIDKIKKKYNLDLNELSRSIWSLDENQSQKQKQLQRIHHVIKALDHEHSMRIQSLDDEHTKSIETLSHRIEEEQHRRKWFQEQMAMYNVQWQRATKRMQNIDGVIISDQRQIELLRKQNESLKLKMSKHISPNTVQEKKESILKLEDRIKEVMVQIQRVKARKTSTKKVRVKTATKSIQVDAVKRKQATARSILRRKVSLITALGDDSVEISSPDRSLSSSPMLTPSPSKNGEQRSRNRKGTDSKAAGLGLNYVPMYHPEATEHGESESMELQVEDAAIGQATSMAMAMEMDGDRAFDDLAELTANLWKHRMNVVQPKVYRVSGKKKTKPTTKRKLTIPVPPKLKSSKSKICEKLKNVDWNKAFKESDLETTARMEDVVQSAMKSMDRNRTSSSKRPQSASKWREQSLDSAETQEKISMIRTSSMGHKAAVYVPFPTKLIVAKQRLQKIRSKKSRPKSNPKSSVKGAMTADDVMKKQKITSHFARTRSLY